MYSNLFKMKNAFGFNLNMKNNSEFVLDHYKSWYRSLPILKPIQGKALRFYI